jgi:hypothetical protein
MLFVEFATGATLFQKEGGTIALAIKLKKN